MYIIKNALRCVSRAKGRNVLIGIIALIIAVSACLGLSIRQAAENAKESTLEGMSVTGTISYDRQSMMGGFGSGMPDFSGEFDKDAFEDMMSDASSLTLEEYLVYANASTVEDFYYTLTAYFDGSENFEPVTTDSSSGSSGSSGFPGGMPGGMGGFGGMMGMGSSSAWPSPVRCPMIPILSLLTSLPATWTRKPRTKLWRSSAILPIRANASFWSATPPMWPPLATSGMS